MTSLGKPVQQAQRRLWLNRWLSALGWALSTAAAAFIVFVVVDRLWLALPMAVLGYVAGGAALLAVLVATIWTLVTRESFMLAAVELDVAANLRERLSTGLYCERLDDPVAHAVVADARKVAASLRVPEHVPVRVPRSAPWAGGSLVAALLFFWLFPAVDLSGKQEERNEEIARQNRIVRTQAMMQPVISQQIQKVGERNPELKKELEQELEPLKDAKLETPADVRREAIKKLEKLADKVEARRNSDELARAEEFKKLMRRVAALQNQQSPVGELAKALSKGDFKAAQDALEQLKTELAKAANTPEEKARAEALKKQLEQLSDKLKAAAEDQKKNEEELRKAGLTREEIQKALENLKKNDLDALKKQLADKGLDQQQIQKMMDQMQKRQEAAEAARKLADNFKGAAQDAGSGELSQEALEGMQAAAEQLGEMEALEQQMQGLQAALADLKKMKDALGQGCQSCQGTGHRDGKPCHGCQGTGQGQRQQNIGGMGPNAGLGQGGIAKREEVETKTVQKRSPVNTLPGRIISQQFIDGEQFKGDVSPDFAEAAVSAERRVGDAIAREQIPRAIQGSVSKYFTRNLADLPAEQRRAPVAPDGPQ